MYDQSAETWHHGDVVFYLTNTERRAEHWEVAVSYVVPSEGSRDTVLADGYQFWDEEHSQHYPYAFRSLEDARKEIDAELEREAIHAETFEGRLEKIAFDQMSLETLRRRMMDSLDFTEVAVWEVRNALVAAYNMGIADAERERKPKPRRSRAK